MLRDRVIPGRIKRVLYKEVKWYDEYGAEEGIKRKLATVEDAEVVSSEMAGPAVVPGSHAPVLDIDVPAFLVPSSTPGHSHLYIDVPMSWRQYKRLLKAMSRANILERGYVKASVRRHHTSVRVPWVKKEMPNARP